jgi:hypothetical protein
VSGARSRRLFVRNDLVDLFPPEAPLDTRDVVDLPGERRASSNNGWGRWDRTTRRAA